MEYQDHVQSLSDNWPELAQEIAPYHTMENVMKWMNARGIPLADMDLVQQDEFSLDVLVPLDTSGRHLVFGIT
jgi:hypothetical protein